jgi:minor histocompatibility antigen H13
MPSKMTLENSFAVPFFSSAVLFGFWCLLKYFPDLDLKVVLKSYLFLVGSIAVGSNFSEPLSRWLKPLAAIKKSITFPKWLIQDQGQGVTADVRATDLLAAAIGITISVINVFPDAPYSVNNFIAICLVSELLQTLSLGSFVTAAALLAGLLCYDVFWVFGSPSVIGDNVMVTVATSKSFLSSPMMLQFPVLNPGPSGRGFTILGLGDITVPGLLIALALRFDRYRSSSSNEGVEAASTSTRGEGEALDWLDSIDDKTYFRTCLAAYCVGLGVTFVANSFSGAAQPALLYLVPAVLCGGSLAAVQRGEFRALLDYRDRAGLEEAVPEPIEVTNSDKLMK